MGWRFSHDPEITPDDLIGACLTDGRHEIKLLAYVRIDGPVACIAELHVQGAGAHSLGIGGIRGLARWTMEVLGVNELRIEGAARTSGAGPGRRPAPLVFRRAGHAGAAPHRDLRTADRRR